MMISKEKVVMLGGFSGLVSVFIFSLFLVVSIYLHRDFTLIKNSISDLGKLGAKYAYIFNGGMILSGIFFFLFSISLILFYLNRPIKYSAGVLLLISSIFLILIGLFPKGTSFHNPFAVIYYNLAMVGIFVYGIDEIIIKKYPLGTYSVIVLPMGYLFYFLYPRIGFGTAELGEAILMILWIVILSTIMLKQQKI